MKLKLRLMIVVMTILMTTNSFSQKLWKTSNFNGKLNGISISKLKSNNYSAFSLDFNLLKQQLKEAPLRGYENSNTLVKLPNDEGKIETFKMYEAPVFSPSLAAKYPNIKSYIGISVQNPATTVRMSVSPKGVETMITYSDKMTVFMQPIDGSIDKYIIYNRNSREGLAKDGFICKTYDELKKETHEESYNNTARDANDQTLRKFRIAISVNGEYTAYHGGTVAGALAAINATLTRVNQVFETDMAVTFELVDATQLIFTNAATDPYSSSLSAWNVELQNTLTNTIGNAAYDIGHMFGASGGGGNAGCIGCVCEDDTPSTSDKHKGAGITSPIDGNPQGDNFDIDFVAHEIGHQMGANHTFSHGNEGAGVNAEPGSGSTIMGYAGIVAGSNVQQHSDPYFHYYSIKQILDNLVTRTCWQNNNPVTLTNNPPVANAGTDYTIPKGTAYVLKGSATDADGSDNLYYCWEQIDDGTVTGGSFGPTNTTGAMVRSLNPTTSPNRYIPKLDRVISGNLTQTNPTIGSAWETVSTVGRDLNFALTVRDRQPTGNGLGGQSSFDTMKITVDPNAGPFAITSQTSNETWDVGATKNVTWDVAGTNGGAVNTPTVNILLSIDGGQTFPYTLATNVPNDGSETVTVPNVGGNNITTARIIVEGNNNIFYAMNSADFSIEETEFTFNFSETNVNVCSPNDAVYTFTYNTYQGFNGSTTLSATNLPTGASITFNPTILSANNTTVTATVSDISNLNTGNYSFDVVGTSGAISNSQTISLGVFDTNFTTLNLTYPGDGTTNLELNPVLIWDIDPNASSYDVQVATDNAFTNMVFSGNIDSNGQLITNLNENTTYYWRVKPKNNCGEGSFSTPFSFTTQNCSVCTSVANTAYDTSTTLVVFNTINNVSAKPSGYSDYTGTISTAVRRGDAHDLTVNVNTDGNFLVQTKVWIDWNQDCDFDDPGEEYDLGSATNTANGATSNSPLSVSIPAGATLGNTTMRVSSRYTSSSNVTYPTACQDGADGEVEDYRIIVEDAAAGVEDYTFGNFNLYPNPSKGNFNLKFEVVNTDKVTIKLFDINGRIISEKSYFNTPTIFSKRLTFNKVSKGLYLLRIINGNKQTTKKVIIK